MLKKDGSSASSMVYQVTVEHTECWEVVDLGDQ